MARKRHTAEEIVAKLRQVEMLTAQGRSVAEAIRAIGVTEVSDLLSLAFGVRRAEGRSSQTIEGTGSGECSFAAGGFRPDVGETDPEGGCLGKLVSPARRRACVDHVIAEHGVSERFACRVLGQHRSTQCKEPRTQSDKAALTADIIALAAQYGRYGYRRITALLRGAGWAVNAKRVERIWRREGLKVPTKQPKRARLGSTMDHASVCRRSTLTTSGPTTSLRIAFTTDENSACSTSSTSLRANV